MTHVLSVADGPSRMDAGAVWLQKLPNAVLMTVSADVNPPLFAGEVADLDRSEDVV